MGGRWREQRLPAPHHQVIIETGSPDEDGRLGFPGDRLVAVLVRLSSEHPQAGQWFLEAGLGQFHGQGGPVFADLGAATAWIEHRLRTRRAGGLPGGLQ
ncbi:hypothetical protein E4O86_10255 [Rhizobiales bacterium L72]|uniref:Uncharacterized protein n=1 Tax=Propylenella binzhouense TaxID=2555902 RepID=A0A964WTK3_9HYPH|nr:hypothetical protein [Propylenella binzhouense]